MEVHFSLLDSLYLLFFLYFKWVVPVIAILLLFAVFKNIRRLSIIAFVLGGIVLGYEILPLIISQNFDEGLLLIPFLLGALCLILAFKFTGNEKYRKKFVIISGILCVALVVFFMRLI